MALLEVRADLLGDLDDQVGREAALLGRARPRGPRPASVGDEATAASAHRELGYVDSLAGRRPDAEVHLAQAESLAGTDTDLLAAVRSVRAFNLSDWGGTTRHFPSGTSRSSSPGVGEPSPPRLDAGTGGMGLAAGGRNDAAREWARECLGVVSEAGWIAFRPWPAAVLAETELAAGRPIPDLHQEFALSCQLSDPCWEGGTARVLAMEALASGEPSQALSWVDEARRRVTRETDVYVAVQAAILATDIEVNSQLGNEDRVAGTARALLELAARGHMDDHVERAAAILQRVYRPVAASSQVGPLSGSTRCSPWSTGFRGGMTRDVETH